MKATQFQVGDAVVTPDGAGVIEEIFRGPISAAAIYVVGDKGYYLLDLIPVPKVATWR